MKDYLRTLYKKIAKYHITIWMVVSVFTLCTMIAVYAAYNGTADVKRVVSTQATSSTVFSSNYMETYSYQGGIAVKNLRTTTDGNFICAVTVCNYDQLAPTSPAQGLIEYAFKAELVIYNAATDEYEVVTELQKNGDTVKTFYVQKIMDDNETIATDTPHSINQNGFSYASKVNVVSSAWNGDLQESGTLGDYDAYNYVIEGSGKAEITLKWNPAVVEISEISLHDMGITPQTYENGTYAGWKYFEMEVDSSVRGRYEMQIFKTAGEANDAVIRQNIRFS